MMMGNSDKECYCSVGGCNAFCGMFGRFRRGVTGAGRAVRSRRIIQGAPVVGSSGRVGGCTGGVDGWRAQQMGRRRQHLCCFRGAEEGY